MTIQATQKKWILISSISLIFIVSLLIGAKPTMRSFKIWRARQLIEQAKTEEKNDKLHLAFEKAYTAYKLSPHDETIARYTAQIIEKLSPKDALAFWITLTEETHSLEDTYDTIRLAIILGDLTTAKNYWSQYHELAPNKSKALLLEAQILALEGNFDKAAILASQAVQLEDAPKDADLLYIKLSQLSSQNTQKQSGIDHLRIIATQKDDQGLSAIRTLATYPGNTPKDIELLIEQLNTHPLSTPQDKLLALSLAQKIGKADPDEVLEKAEKLFENASIDEKIELGRWLNQQGSYNKTLHCIPLELAIKRFDLFLIWADAMAVTKQWLPLEKALNDPTVPIDEFLKHLFLARTAEAQNKNNIAAHEWDKAFANANKDVDKLWFLVKYAIRLKHYKEATDGLSRLTQTPSQARLAWEMWVDICFLEQNTESVFKVLQQMADIYPHDMAIANDLRYIQALKGPLDNKMMAKAQILVADEPYMLAYRITLALAFLRNNKPQQALDLLLNLQINWHDVKPGWRCVYAGVLKENDCNALADLILAHIPKERLLPEERVLANL